MRFAIVGAGIVGLATAMKLQQKHPGAEVTLFDKESGVARHQTGRNSGVIHSGLYYPPGSLKARTCLSGRLQMEDFCRSRGVPFERCGKLVLATTPEQLLGLSRLRQRARSHGLTVRWLRAEEIRAFEPHCVGLAALLVAETGIVDYKQVSAEMRLAIEARGGTFRLGESVRSLERADTGWRVNQSLQVDYLVNCAGLYSDEIVRMTGMRPEVRIVPFRGEYYRLAPGARHLCRNLIYPVADPRFPFLGVHFTRGVNGEIEAGPNAVLALGRENYLGSARPKFWREGLSTLGYSGFHRMAAKFWRMGLEEQLRSWLKPLFCRSLQQLVPDTRLSDLLPGGSGIRAQAVTADGRLVDDFVLQQAERVLHVVNAPSPAATASLAIADEIVERIGSAC